MLEQLPVCGGNSQFKGQSESGLGAWDPEGRSSGSLQTRTLSCRRGPHTNTHTQTHIYAHSMGASTPRVRKLASAVCLHTPHLPELPPLRCIQHLSPLGKMN